MHNMFDSQAEGLKVSVPHRECSVETSCLINLSFSGSWAEDAHIATATAHAGGTTPKGHNTPVPDKAQEEAQEPEISVYADAFDESEGAWTWEGVRDEDAVELTDKTLDSLFQGVHPAVSVMLS